MHVQRPWISVEAKLVSPLTYDEGGAHLIIETSLKNVGKMPAFGVRVIPQMGLVCPGSPNLPEQRDRLLRMVKLITSEIGSVAFPDAPAIVSRWLITCARRDIEEACAAVSSSFNFFTPAVIVATAYGTGIDEQLRYGTGAIYEMTNQGRAFQVGETVPLESIVFSISTVGGLVAD